MLSSQLLFVSPSFKFTGTYPTSSDQAHMDHAKLERMFGYTFYRIKETRFSVYRMDSFFNEKAPFSRVNLDIKPYGNEAYGDKAELFLPFDDLFQVDTSLFEESHFEHLRFLKKCKNRQWPPIPKATSKAKLMSCICPDILVPLCKKDEVCVEKRYESYHSRGVKFAAMGMGAFDTWHGTPDARVRGASIILESDSDGSDSDGSDSDGLDSDGSDLGVCQTSYLVRESPVKLSDDSSEYHSDSSGTGTVIETKKRMNHLSQSIATCTVSSFIENSLHPELKSCVPTILIDETQFRVILYDCKTDNLLISEALNLSTKGHLSQSSMTALWVVVNHRSFLQHLPKICSEYPSGIQNVLEKAGALQKFKKLCTKDLNWPRKKTNDEKKVYIKIEVEDRPKRKRKKKRKAQESPPKKRGKDSNTT